MPPSERVQRVSHYRIVRQLGEGGMGVVFEAVDENSGRTVVIKAIKGDEGDASESAVRRFEREGRAGAAVRHENVVTILDGGRSPNGQPYLVFEHLAGGGLDRRLKKEGPLPWREAATLCAAIARGLAAIHAAGLVHRDLKPANVLITADGVPKISDLGLVRADEATGLTQGGLTKTGELLGTLSYISPEQVDQSKSVDGRADLYSFGCMLHALVAGTPPFDGAQMILVKKHLMDPPPRLSALVPDVPAELEALVLALLEKDAAKRPQTAAEVAEALDRIAAGAGEPVRRSKAPVLAAAALVALLGAGGAVAWRAGRASATTEVAPARSASEAPAPVVDAAAAVRSATAFRLERAATWTIRAGQRVAGLVVLEGGDRFVTGCADPGGSIESWRASDGEGLGGPAAIEAPCTGLLRARGDVLFSAHENGLIYRWVLKRDGLRAPDGAVHDGIEHDGVWLGNEPCRPAFDVLDDVERGQTRVAASQKSVVRRLYQRGPGHRHRYWSMGNDSLGTNEEVRAVKVPARDLLLSASHKLGVRLFRVKEDDVGADEETNGTDDAAPVIAGANALAVSPTDRSLAFVGTLDGEVARLTLIAAPDSVEVKRGPLVRRHPGAIFALEVSPDGALAVSASRDDQDGVGRGLKVWGTEEPLARPVAELRCDVEPTSVAWGPDCSWFLVGFADGTVQRVRVLPKK